MSRLKTKRIFRAERKIMRAGGGEALENSGEAESSSEGIAAVLAAIAELRQEIAELKNSTGASKGESGETAVAADGTEIDDQHLRIEIAQMVRSIGRAKSELASIKHPMAEDDRIKAATNQLDEIVLATETATHDILQAAENLGKFVDHVAARYPSDHETLSMAEDAAKEVITIMEACSFQDITGQRIQKVVKTMRFIQDRIVSMIGIWGVEAFADLPVPEDTVGDDGAGEGEEALLNGPQVGNEGLSQEDIDALFD